MIHALFSIPIIGLLLFGGIEEPPSNNQSTQFKAVVVDSYTIVSGSSEEVITQVVQLGAYCDDALSNAAASSYQVREYESLSSIPTLELEKFDVFFQLEIKGIADVSQVKSKEKTRMTIKKLRQQWIFDHYYKGEIGFEPEVVLVIKTPQKQQLVDRITLPLGRYSAYIENAEAAEGFDIGSVLTLESVEGITDVLDDLMKDISIDIQDELETILSGESLRTINSKIQTLKNKN